MERFYKHNLIKIPDDFYKNDNHPFAEIIKSNTRENIDNIMKKIEELSVHDNKSYQTIHHMMLV